MRKSIDALLVVLMRVLAVLGGIGVVAMLVHICVYVVGRHFVATPVPATVEIVSRYYMVFIAFLPLAWAEQRGDMISVEVFAPLFAGRLKRLNGVFVTLVTLSAYAALTYTTWVVAMKEFAAKSFVISLSVAVPVWPSYFILPLSFALAVLVCLIRLILLFSDDRPQQPETHDMERAA